MQKFLHPSLIVSVILAFVLSACGRESTYSQNKMTEDQAFKTLSNVPMTQARGAFGKKSVSAQGLKELLLKLIQEGKIQVPGHSSRGAIASTPDLSALTNILDMITSGNGTNIFSLAVALLNQASGNGEQVKLDISFIVGILTAALPIIAGVAPQFAPMVQALLVILPLVASLINLFKKPTPSPTASFLQAFPVRA